MPNEQNQGAAVSDPARAAFEQMVEQWTGRDMEYHVRAGTTGMEFSWHCYQRGLEAGRNE